MSDVEHTAAARDAGLTGWKASVHRHPEAAGFVAVLTSPDYNPIRKSGRIVTARGRDQAEAFARVLESAKGSVH